jgi:dienelactone hydrolase
VSLQLSDTPLTLTRLAPPRPAASPSVVFLPGDGGWRGTAVTIARAIAAWGYVVYGLDTRKYLELRPQHQPPFTVTALADDITRLAAWVAGPSRQGVILVGWSQGATMAVAAASHNHQAPIRGVITLGLPETGVLGWDWKATLAVLARRAPDQPSFATAPLLPGVAPTPLWMIHGAADQYTAPAAARNLYQLAAEPKRLEEIPGANHRFDGHEAQLYDSLRKGLSWIALSASNSQPPR